MLTSEPDQSVSPAREEHGSRLIVFSPWYYGHHPSYLRHLILYWRRQKLSGKLNIVVMPSFLKNHADVVALTKDCPGIQFVALTPEEQIRLESTPSSFGKAIVQYQLIVRYARQLQATHGLLMHFDSCQIPFVLGLKLPCPFSAIYFRPTFHYGNFSGNTLSWKERLQHLRERFFISRLLVHPQFKALFCLDPMSIAPINQYRHRNRQAKAVHLPDPVELQVPCRDAVEALKQNLGIEPGRKAFLAFGVLADGRKGTRQLLEALSLLEPALCQKLCILLVGEPFEAGQSILESWLEPVRQLPVQIVTRFGYVPESDVPLYFNVSDAVMAPYQKPAGMSGLLLLAAVAQKPVLSSNYGLIGELVKQYGLGLAVDTTDAAEIARGLAQLLTKSTADICDFEQMRAFAEMNSVEQFASTIFQHVYETQDAR